MSQELRLNKYIASLGISSRREADRWIREGLIKINGKIENNPAHRVDPHSVRLELNEKIRQILNQRITVKVYKPVGIVVSSQKAEGMTIYDLIQSFGLEGLFPVGRLDKDSEGLILMTNDPTLTTRLIGEKSFVEKEYLVKTEKALTDGTLRKLERGIPMMGSRTRPAKVKRISSNAFRITLTEGKNRQIRRMCRKVGHQVKELKRIRIGEIRLGKLQSGQWQKLSEQERIWINSMEVQNHRS